MDDFDLRVSRTEYWWLAAQKCSDGPVWVCVCQSVEDRAADVACAASTALWSALCRVADAKHSQKDLGSHCCVGAHLCWYAKSVLPLKTMVLIPEALPRYSTYRFHVC